MDERCETSRGFGAVKLYTSDAWSLSDQVTRMNRSKIIVAHTITQLLYQLSLSLMKDGEEVQQTRLKVSPESRESCGVTDTLTYINFPMFLSENIHREAPQRPRSKSSNSRCQTPQTRNSWSWRHAPSRNEESAEESRGCPSKAARSALSVASTSSSLLENHSFQSANNRATATNTSCRLEQQRIPYSCDWGKCRISHRQDITLEQLSQPHFTMVFIPPAYLPKLPAST